MERKKIEPEGLGETSKDNDNSKLNGKKKRRFIWRMWDKFMPLTSIRKRISTAILTIIVLLLIPSAINIIFTGFQTKRYNQLISTVSKSGRLTKIIGENIPGEMYEIVTGRRTFLEGSQYEIIADIERQLKELSFQASESGNDRLLVVVERAMGNLKEQIDRLGWQTETNKPVEEWEQTLEQIFSSVAVINDQLNEFILLEIENAEQINRSIQFASQITIAAEIVITIAVCLFAMFTQAEVSRSISKPIYELEELAGQFASGDLDARAEQTNVEELVSLTASLNIMATKLQVLMDDNIREQENLKKSEMRTLQAQITPHFLYNTLDAIMWLAETDRNEEVISITKAMSNFFRIALSRGKDWISIAQEIEHVKSYLMVQQVRYRDILSYRFEIDERLDDQTILKLVLQPLVENAIYHGIKLRRERGTIVVRGKLEGDFMHLCVEDNGMGMTEERLKQVRESLSKAAPDSGGYGLYNVDKRLRLYYGQNAGLVIDSTYGAGTTVEFRVPVRSEGNNV